MKQHTIIKSFTFSYYVTMAIVVSFLPIYYDSLGYSKLQIGTLYSIGPMMGIISNLVWGLISDKFQTLKKTILIVLFGQLVMLLLLFQTDIYSIIMIIMTGFYFFQTPLNGLNDSQLLLTVRNSGKSYASFRVWGSIGFACSAFLIGRVLNLLGIGSMSTILLTSVSISIILALLLKDVRQGMSKTSLAGVWTLVFTKRFLIFLGLIFLMSMAHRTNDGFLSLYMKDLGADKSWIGLAMMTSAISEIPVFFLLSRFGHKFRELPLLAIACLTYSIRFSLMSIIDRPEWVIAIQTLHSLSFGIFLFTALRYMQELIPDRYRATGQAVFNMTWGGFAGLFSGFFGGRIYDVWGGAVLYRFAAAAAIAACLGFLITHWLQKDQSLPQSQTQGESE